MSFRLLLSPKSQKFLNKLRSNEDRLRVEKKLKSLKDNSELGKPLTGNLSGLWSLRFGKFRALYQIRHGELIILVLDLGHRKNIYD